MEMLVVDYDGTLASSDSFVDSKTKEKLRLAGELGVIRVINTGRSLFSIRNVIDDDFPIDYIIFSAGIGIFDWKKKKLLVAHSFNPDDTKRIYKYLCDFKYDFMVQLPVPDNHYFHHFGDLQKNSDFKSRVSSYESYGIKPISACPEISSQFVVICLEGSDYYETIKRRFKHVNVVKATSPINHKSIWVELLPPNVSKASGVEFLSSKLGVDRKKIVAVGNDYYDLDMLKYVDSKNAYVVSNAPDQMKPLFNNILSNDESAVAELIDRLYLH